MKASREPGANAAMLREWYSEVIKHAAFVFVEDTTESDEFLTVYMGSMHNNQPPYLTAGKPSLERLRKAMEQSNGD